MSPVGSGGVRSKASAHPSKTFACSVRRLNGSMRRARTGTGAEGVSPYTRCRVGQRAPRPPVAAGLRAGSSSGVERDAQVGDRFAGGRGGRSLRSGLPLLRQRPEARSPFGSREGTLATRRCPPRDRVPAREPLLAEEYRQGHLTKPDLRRLPGFETSDQIDGFLRAHEVWIEYTLEDLERERAGFRRLGL